MLAYRPLGITLLLLAGVSLSACGRETGILVAVTHEAGVQVDALTLSVGSDDGQPDRYVRRVENTDVQVDVAGRDLIGSPYSVLFTPSKMPADPLYVAVVGTLQGRIVAFGSFPRSQPFMENEILMRTVMLKAAAEGQDVSRTATGCLMFGDASIAPEEDRDCDNFPTPADCDDTDPGVNPDAKEACGNDRDDNCDGVKDEGCAMDVCKAGEFRPCYLGPSNTSGMGVCRDGVESCVSGQWGKCTAQVVPSAESCNGLDDNCDGVADNDLPTISCGVGECTKTVPSCVGGFVQSCTPGTPLVTVDDTADGKDNDCDGAIDEDVATCVHVATTGNDALAVADDNVTPFATITAALAWAKAEAARPRIICVAAAAACGTPGTYAAVSLTMENGYSVYGNYESTTWKRCDPATTTTILQLAAATGVSFPSSVNSVTVLDGFQLERLAGGSNAAVTVTGATHAQISNVTIPAVTGTTTVGIALTGGAQALITRSAIFAGSGTTLSAGVLSVGSTPTLRSNCGTFDGKGRCAEFCPQGMPGIRGRQSGVGGIATESYAVLLKDSPNAVIETSALCQASGDNVAALRVQGKSPGVVARANTLTTGAGLQNAHGVWLEECDNQAPWILDNAMIEANGSATTTRVSGVRAVGACHPVIEQNTKIVAGSEGGAASGTGVYCGENGPGVHSECVVVDNKIEGSMGGFPAASVAVDCDRGCAQVVNNVLDARTGVEAIGMRLIRTGTLVDNNRISGGCGSKSSIGLRSDDSFARVQNNRITNGACAGLNTMGLKFVAVRVNAAMGFNEVDVHSNTLDAAGNASACDSAAIELAAGASGPGAPRGIYRNNILRAGLCTGARYGVRELDAGADPRLLEHQDFDPFMSPVLYQNENTTAITTVGAIDMLTGAKQNISVDPSFVSYPSDLHITATSMCIAKGTMVGAPARDMDGQMRKATPDIGADER